MAATTVPSKTDVFPPESLLKKNKDQQAQAAKAAETKAANKKVCLWQSAIKYNLKDGWILFTAHVHVFRSSISCFLNILRCLIIYIFGRAL
jgi:inorganic triphosphatase YgiF